MAEPIKATEYNTAFLDKLDTEFRNNPPEAGSKYSVRKNAFENVDKLLKTMSHKQWKAYMHLFDDKVSDSKTKLLETEKKIASIEQNGLPYFISKRLKYAIRTIKDYKIADAVTTVTYMYNHGFVIQTGKTTLGIDLAGPHVEKLADVLDALVVSHWHPDHYNTALIVSMLKASKPVYIRGFSGSPSAVRKSYPGKLIDPAEGEHAVIGTSKLIFHHGDHYPDNFVKHNPKISVSRSNVLDTIIITDYRKEHPSLTIFHDGDDFNKDSKLKAVKDKKIDVFLGHGVPGPERWKDSTSRDANKWLELNDSIGDPFGTAREIDATLFIAGHQAERGHPDCIGGCTPFKDALNFVANLPAGRGRVMLWGEHIRITPKQHNLSKTE